MIGAESQVDIAVEGIVVDYLILQIIRTFQVERTLIEVAQGVRLGALNLPASMQQRIGNGIFIELHGLGCAGMGFLFIVLKLRQSYRIAEGCHHQPSQ